MESPTTLLFEVREHVAYITLNRPAVANAVSLELAQELEEVARECDESSTVRAVLLTGAGRIFCGGGDKSFAAQEPNHVPTHRPRERIRTFHDGLLASRLNARRLLHLLSTPNHRTYPYDGTGVDESNFNSARGRSDWSSHASSAR